VGQLDPSYLAKCVTTITNAAADALNWSQQCAYGSSFPQPTKQVEGAGWYFSASQAFDLAVGYQLNPNPAYLDAMLANVNYEGGCNPVNVTYVTGLGWQRQRQIVDQYSWNDGRTMPRSGTPIGNIQQGTVWTSTYGSDLGNLTFPSDNANSAPFPFYDRWADTVNVTTEFVVTDLARGLGTVAFLAAMTSLSNQTWVPFAGQITRGASQSGSNSGGMATFQAPGLDLSDARIVWETPGQEPAYGPSYVLDSTNAETGWVEAEAQLPDGRRVFGVLDFAVTNGPPNAGSPSVIIQKAATGGVTLTWPTTPGKTYWVTVASNLTSSLWTTGCTSFKATGTTASWTDSSAGSARQRFYRLYSAD